MSERVMDRVQWGRMVGVLEEVRTERERQHAMRGEQNLRDGRVWWEDELGTVLTELRELQKDNDQRWAEVFLEEVAEAVVAPDPVALRAELVQVAAVAVQWIEAIDRRRA